MKKETVLITGGTSGFGVKFAHIFARNGYDIVLVSRTAKNLTKTSEELTRQYGVTVTTVPIDLTESGSTQKLYDMLRKRRIPVDVLINNAGIGNYGRFTDIPWDKEHRLLELNIVALSHLCHLFIPDMIKRGKGKILNIASLAAFQPGPLYATYFASKGYVLQFTEALIEEYKGAPITISALCPCPSPTDFFNKAGMHMESLLLRTSFIAPEKIAQEGYEGLMRGKRIIIPGIRYKFVARSHRIMPRVVMAKITKMLVQVASARR